MCAVACVEGIENMFNGIWSELKSLGQRFPLRFALFSYHS